MCGIVGVIPGNTQGHILARIFKNLLIVNSLRGTDGTGVFWKSKKEDVATYVKRGVSSTIFVDLPDTTTVFKDIKEREFMVGHNRAGTVGENSDANSHPFSFGNVIGVHNGTLRGHYLLSKKHHDVDSMAIFHSLDENDDVKVTMNNLRGAAALVWYDHRTGHLNFWRNNERPLYFITDEQENTWFASEPWMVTGLLGREGIKTKKVEALETEHLVWYTPADGKFHKRKLEQGKTMVYHGADYYGDGLDWESSFRKENSNVVPFKVEQDKQKLVGLAIPAEDAEFVIPDTDYGVYQHNISMNLPERIWQNSLRVGDHIFFCITTHHPSDKHEGSTVVDITGELHDVNDVVIRGFVSKVILNFTYGQKCMLYGKIISISSDAAGRVVQVSHVRATTVVDPLFMFAAGIKVEA